MRSHSHDESDSVVGRPTVAFLAWTPVTGRSLDMARALGGDALCIRSLAFRRPVTVPIKYLWATIRTLLYLARTRPRSIIATNPPVIPGLIALAYARLFSATVILDSHPGAFGLMGDAVGRRLLPVHAWMARRVTASLVSSAPLTERVRGWGGRAEIVHEAPPAWELPEARPLPARPTVLFIGIYARDEPLQPVLAAAQAIPEADFYMTGDLKRLPESIRATAPSNVKFTGFLEGDDFTQAVANADIVLTLSTEPTSVMRAGYEAVYARRPLVLSDWPVLREYFPFAVHAKNTSEGVTAAVRAALDGHAELVSQASTALAVQRERWALQLETLRGCLGLPSDDA